MDAIHAHEITKSNVIGIRKAINAAERRSRGWSTRNNPAPMTFEEWDALEAALASERPKVTGELHDSGLAVLRNPRYRKRWDDRQKAIIASLSHFWLVGFERIGSHNQYATPIYEAWGRNQWGSLDSFKFINIPWQSGGDGPEIIS